MLRANTQKGITQRGITQKSNTQRGITQRAKTQKGITQRDNAQKGITQKGSTQRGIAQKGNTQKGIARKALGKRATHDENFTKDPGLDLKQYYCQRRGGSRIEPRKTRLQAEKFSIELQKV